jgi:hypothetical protein
MKRMVVEFFGHLLERRLAAIARKGKRGKGGEVLPVE